MLPGLERWTNININIESQDFCQSGMGDDKSTLLHTHKPLLSLSEGMMLLNLYFNDNENETFIFFYKEYTYFIQLNSLPLM